MSLKELSSAALVLLAMLPAAASTTQGVGARLAGATAEQGKLAFHTCAACHTVDKGGPTRVGPNLWNVVERPIASVDGFDYSEALTGLGGAWNFQRLEDFLAAPLDYAPGTRMVYPGVQDPGTRAAIIRYLVSLSDMPVDLPKSAGGATPRATDPFGEDWPQGEGRDLTGFACQSCHSLAIVKQQGLPRKRWDEMLDWMVEEQGMDPLVPDERTLVLEYLSAHFGIDR